MASEKKPISTLKRATMQVAAGGSAGFIEVCIMQPLDVVKTRMQLQNTTKASQDTYNGVFDCFAKMYKREGLGSFWKGILPPILADTPKRAIKFLVYEQSRPFFLFGSPTPTPLTFSMGGLTAGLVEAVAVNPFEVVKITQQADRSRTSHSPGTWAITRQIIKKDGLGFRGLNKGLTATLWRHGVYNSIYFGFYHSVRTLAPAYDDPRKEFMRKVVIGFTSGTIASLVNIPFDVAKSRIQGPQPQKDVIKYKSVFKTIATVYREEGFKALYKGIVPKVMRLGPGGAIMLLVFEYAYNYLQRTFG